MEVPSKAGHCRQSLRNRPFQNHLVSISSAADYAKIKIDLNCNKQKLLFSILSNFMTSTRKSPFNWQSFLYLHRLDLSPSRMNQLVSLFSAFSLIWFKQSVAFSVFSVSFVLRAQPNYCTRSPGKFCKLKISLKQIFLHRLCT